MFALNLLGGAALEGRGGPVTGKAAHRRRLALLAILSVARGRAVGRERVIGLLWPDHRTDAARHVLSESLYVLRKELGDDAFVASGDEVALNPAVVRCDVAEFDRAVEEGRLEDAAALYRGPFLDGFYVTDAPEFERWVDGERDRLARQQARALECLAEAAEAGGRPRDAVRWWRGLAVHDPWNSRVGIRLMQALDGAGERAAALWFAETHVALLRDELGVEPDAEFAALVDRLRTEPVRVPAHAAAPPRPAADRTVEAAHAGPVDGAPTDPATTHVPTAAGAMMDGKALDEMHSAALDGVTVPEDAADVSADARAGATPSAPSSGGAAADHSHAATDAPPAPAAADHAPASAGRPQAERAAGAATALHRPGDAAMPSLGGVILGPPHARDGARTGANGRRWSDGLAVRAAAVLGLVVGLAAAALAGARWPAGEPARGGEYDPRRIAVLYFDDYSRGGELEYLANGLTESLIHALAQVQALDVISRNGVKPYRDRPVLFDSMVADLRAGSVVEGSVQRVGNRVRVTVQLVDGNTNSHLESRTLVMPADGGFALEDAVVEQVSRFLRRRVGREIRLRHARAETRSAEAWRLVMRAEQAAHDAERLAGTGNPLDVGSAERLLIASDSMLARAARADPAWTRPVVLRSWAAYRRASLPGARAREPLLATARRWASAVLAREPANASALELRGTLVLREATGPADSAAHARRLEQAERDLRAAVAAEPGRATAWRTLSLVLRYRGRFADSHLAARRALAADAYLDDADDILHRLYFGALLLGDYAEARDVCERGRREAPDDWRFLECELTLMREDPSRAPDPARARALLAALHRVDPPARAAAQGRAYSPVYRLALAAAIAARAQMPDSARALLERARRAAGASGELHLSLGYDEAAVLLLLGEREAARARLHDVLARRPALRPFASRDPLLRELFRPPAAAGATRAGAPPGP